MAGQCNATARSSEQQGQLQTSSSTLRVCFNFPNAQLLPPLDLLRHRMTSICGRPRNLTQTQSICEPTVGRTCGGESWDLHVYIAPR